MKIKIFVIMGTMLAAASPPLALATIFDFAGTGTLCAYTGAGSTCTYNVDFAGTVTIAVDPAGPSGSDAASDGVTFATDLNGWVQSSFNVTWTGGSFMSGPTAGENYSDNLAEVQNAVGSGADWS